MELLQNSCRVCDKVFKREKEKFFFENSSRFSKLCCLKVENVTKLQKCIIQFSFFCEKGGRQEPFHKLVKNMFLFVILKHAK
jgi:hypothetical protein